MTYYYVSYISFVALTVIYVRSTIRHKGIIFNPQSLAECRLRVWIYNNLKQINIVLHLFFVPFFIWFSINAIIPMTKDLPLALTGKQQRVSGYTCNASGRGGDEISQIDVSVKDGKNGDILRLRFYGNRIEEGTYVVLDYLPNSGYAQLLYRNPPFQKKGIH